MKDYNNRTKENSLVETDYQTVVDCAFLLSPTSVAAESDLYSKKTKQGKSDILDFMGNLKKYFKRKNSLEDYEFIVECFANLSSKR